MEIIVQTLGERLVIKALGRIDSTTAAEYGTTINDAIDDSSLEIKDLVLDFAGIDYISSIGLRVILELKKRMTNQGSMKITNVIPAVKDVFEMTGFTKIITIE